MVRDTRIKQYIFSPAELTVNAAGSGTVYSSHSINGIIQNIVLQIIIFASGLSNSGTALGEHIITLRAGSSNREYYPFAYGDVNQAASTSGTTFAGFIQKAIHAPVRLAFSGCGASTSGLGLTINYI